MRLYELLSYLATIAALSCKGEGGEDVGSWVLFKFPQSTSYVYDSNNYQSPYSLNDTMHGALAYTMQQLWSPKTQYVLYNDEPPYAKVYNFSVAHAKAAILWDNTSAIAIMHSIPKFPVGPEQSTEYSGLLQNAWEYAQHVACLTIPIHILPAYLESLQSLNPRVYEGEFQFIEIEQSETCNYLSVGDRILITKSAAYQVDIWSACVSQYFKTDLRVISWIRGQQDGTIINGTTTMDITQISYPFGVNYTEWDNHAKWAIGEHPLVCVGDLNRVESQMERSGAALCWKDLELWTALFNVCD